MVGCHMHKVVLPVALSSIMLDLNKLGKTQDCNVLITNFCINIKYVYANLLTIQIPTP